jgi:hypothetical protein
MHTKLMLVNMIEFTVFFFIFNLFANVSRDLKKQDNFPIQKQTSRIKPEENREKTIE